MPSVCPVCASDIDAEIMQVFAASTETIRKYKMPSVSLNDLTANHIIDFGTAILEGKADRIWASGKNCTLSSWCHLVIKELGISVAVHSVRGTMMTLSSH